MSIPCSSQYHAPILSRILSSDVVVSDRRYLGFHRPRRKLSSSRRRFWVQSCPTDCLLQVTFVLLRSSLANERPAEHLAVSLYTSVQLGPSSIAYGIDPSRNQLEETKIMLIDWVTVTLGGGCSLDRYSLLGCRQVFSRDSLVVFLCCLQYTV